MEFRGVVGGACTNYGVDRGNLGQRYISTNGEGGIVIVRKIVRRIILLSAIFASRRMFVSVIVVVRMHSADRTQIVVTAQMRTPRGAWHDKRADEQNKGEDPEHRQSDNRLGAAAQC